MTVQQGVVVPRTRPLTQDEQKWSKSLVEDPSRRDDFIMGLEHFRSALRLPSFSAPHIRFSGPAIVRFVPLTITTLVVVALVFINPPSFSFGESAPLAAAPAVSAPQWSTPTSVLPAEVTSPSKAVTATPTKALPVTKPAAKSATKLAARPAATTHKVPAAVPKRAAAPQPQAKAAPRTALSPRPAARPAPRAAPAPAPVVQPVPRVHQVPPPPVIPPVVNQPDPTPPPPATPPPFEAGSGSGTTGGPMVDQQIIPIAGSPQMPAGPATVTTVPTTITD